MSPVSPHYLVDSMYIFVVDLSLWSDLTSFKVVCCGKAKGIEFGPEVGSLVCKLTELIVCSPRYEMDQTFNSSDVARPYTCHPQCSLASVSILLGTTSQYKHCALPPTHSYRNGPRSSQCQDLSHVQKCRLVIKTQQTTAGRSNVTADNFPTKTRVWPHIVKNTMKTT